MIRHGIKKDDLLSAENEEEQYYKEKIRTLEEVVDIIYDNLRKKEEKQMIQKCLNCGTELTIKNSQIEHDTLGSYVICDKCGASFDINNTTTEWCSNCENETEQYV